MTEVITIRHAPEVSPTDSLEEIRQHLLRALKSINDARNRPQGLQPARLNSNQLATLQHCRRAIKRLSWQIRFSIR